MPVNIKSVSHKKSAVIENGLPKLPTAAQLELGELAINFADGYETLSIKNSNNEIVTFTNDLYWKNKELVISNALNDLNSRINNIPSQVQADWNQTNTTALDYIKNKPSITQDHNDYMIINPSSVDINTSNGLGGIDINGGLALTLTAKDNNICFNSGAEEDQLLIHGEEGVFVEGANNKNIKLTTLGNGKAYYNNNEIATKNDIPTVSTTVTESDTNPVSGGAVFSYIADIEEVTADALTDLDSRIPLNIVTGTSAGYVIWSGTQAQYNALSTYDSNTIYLIKET